MRNRFFLFATLVATLLLLPVIVLNAQSNEADSAESTPNPALQNEIVGRLFIKEFTNTADFADAIEVIDYGRFQWAIFPAGSRAAQQLDTVSFNLQLGNGIVETTAETASALAADNGREGGNQLHLVQLIGPVKADWRERIEASGLEIVQYIYPFTYVVYGEQAQVDAVNSAEFTRWNAPFATDYRILPELQTINSRTPVPHRIVALNSNDIDALASQVSQLTQSDAAFTALNDTWSVATVALTTETLAQVAALSGVYSIQPEPTDGGPRGELTNQITVRNLDALGVVQTGYEDWLNQVGVNGNGVIVANVDDGIQQSHPDLAANMLDCVGTTCGNNVTSSHGTHTAGIIAATGTSSPLLNGFKRGLGVAPGANMVEQLYSPTYQSANGMLTLMRESVQNGAVISANSWGPSGTPRGYDNNTLQVDIGVRDADATTAGNQPLSYILSFMNGYGGTSSQGSPDEAKNVFTIGSSNAQFTNGDQSNDLFSLSRNSAHGPALDGRIIPHMIAPGCYTDSTVNTNAYGFKCGTSMASPHVSGGAALFFEAYRLQYGQDPSPAMVKAAFTVVADSMAGNDDADDDPLGQPFDSKQGWGLFNLSEVISPTQPVLYIDQTTLFTQTGQAFTLNVGPATPDEPMRIMLTWSDAPGHGLGGNTPAWVNNLDLIASHDGNIYVGNQFDANGWSEPSVTLDSQNNTEGIFFENIAAEDELQLIVLASDVNSDGVPNNDIAIDQDFALACYNCVPLTTTQPTSINLSMQKTHQANSAAIISAGFAAGTLLTYAVTRTVTLNGSYVISSTLADTPPAGLEILPETIRVNGQLEPTAYDAERGEIVVQESLELVNVIRSTVLTYQARIKDEAIGMQLTNHASSMVMVNGAVRHASASDTIQVNHTLYLPVIMQDSP